jgi:hypothetical protein
MTHSPVPIAVSSQLVQELLIQAQTTVLTRSQRRQLQHHLQAMVGVVEQSRAAQDASSAIYTYAVGKANTTLATVELLKALRSPLLASPELEAVEQALRQQYLEQVQRIMARGIYQILTAAER